MAKPHCRKEHTIASKTNLLPRSHQTNEANNATINYGGYVMRPKCDIDNDGLLERFGEKTEIMRASIILKKQSSFGKHT